MLFAPGAFMTTIPRALAAATGDHSQRLCRGNERRRDPGGAAHDKRVGVGNVGRKLIGSPPGSGVNRPALCFQELKCGFGEIVGDNNFHDGTRDIQARSNNADA
jgi:hypothetical protein